MDKLLDLAHAFFDEVITYYETAPSLPQNDTAKDGGSAADIEIPWREAENLLGYTGLTAAVTGIDSVGCGNVNVRDLFRNNVTVTLTGSGNKSVPIRWTAYSFKVTYGNTAVGPRNAEPDIGTYTLALPDTDYKVSYIVSYADRTATGEFTIHTNSAGDAQNRVNNGGFETGDLTGWTTETAGFNTATAVISAAAYWGENLPYNQAGDYHLDGWNTGIGEGDTWTVRSGTFTLGGSGYISVRMGGHAAAVHVYKTDGTEIGCYKQNRFADHDFPYLKNGGSWADMGTYVIDLSEYLGNDLYIELCDEAVDGWAHAFFDEVVTYYATAPNYQSLADTVIDGNNSGAVDIPWQLATDHHGLMGMNFNPMMLSLSAPPAEPLPLPENTDSEEAADGAGETATDPAEASGEPAVDPVAPPADDPFAEPAADEPEPAAPVNEEDVPTPKEEDDPDDEDSPDQEGEPVSEGEPEPKEASDAESQNGEP